MCGLKNKNKKKKIIRRHMTIILPEREIKIFKEKEKNLASSQRKKETLLSKGQKQH